MSWNICPECAHMFDIVIIDVSTMFFLRTSCYVASVQCSQTCNPERPTLWLRDIGGINYDPSLSTYSSPNKTCTTSNHFKVSHVYAYLYSKTHSYNFLFIYLYILVTNSHHTNFTTTHIPSYPQGWGDRCLGYHLQPRQSGGCFPTTGGASAVDQGPDPKEDPPWWQGQPHKSWSE